MFRIMSIATLVMIAICFLVSAGFAFADEPQAPNGTAIELPTEINDASRPVEIVPEENLASAGVDIYDFSDYLAGSLTIPTVDAEQIEEPALPRTEARDC
ncbi:hypothetical protein [Dongia sp.]|uniref:hypothetical protein n=1 Tax=Dongia sp. TaxID=1977262 RepID=UPI0035B333C6